MSYEYDGFKSNSNQLLSSLINVDLHIHSIESKYKEKKTIKKNGKNINIVDDSTIDNIDVLLTKLNEKKINMFSFTDHNRFSIDLFEKTCEIIEKEKKYNNIKCLLPGVEFDVQIEDGKNKCHIITIFDARSHNDLEKISSSINEKKIFDENGFYNLYDFEMLMKKIGLNTIFIACQRKDLNNPSGGANCISDSVDDIYDFLKVGFINALEYQKSNVEGMLLNNLKDFPRQMGLVCGSDCHQWEAYPLHDETDTATNNKRYFTIKALPTFLGLLFALTSPNTRFKRKMVNQKKYDCFKFNDKIIPISEGINVIIGENGSGKSTLLKAIGNQKLESYQTDLLKKYEINCKKTVIPSKFISQNEIIDRNKKNNLFSSDLFKEINYSEFENSIKNFSNNLMEYLLRKIKIKKDHDELLDIKINIDAELYYAKTYYIDAILNDINPIENMYTDHLNNLNNILNNLKKEIDSENVYSKDDVIALKKAYNNILIVRSSTLKKYKEIYLKNKIINIIIEEAKEYKNKIKKSSTEQDEATNSYKDGIRKFKNKCANYIKDGILIKYNYPSLTFDFSSKIFGVSENKANGYKFCKIAHYYNKKDIKEEFYKAIFNSAYQTDDSIKKIDTETLLSSAITSANLENYKEKYKDNVDKFIKKEENCSFDVLEESSNEKMGNTLGEKSLVYYKFITSEEADNFNVLFIDQPEDNISNIGIASKLINNLNNLRDNKQIIFVTHNPLLVINLDVDNVIILENKGGNMNIQSGCLECGDNLNKIANLLDGGKELIEKRLKLYYGKENY